MSIVARYLAREFLMAAGTALLALVMVWIAADTLLHVDELRSGVWAALRGVGLRSLDLLPQGVPTACAIGAVFSLSRATRALEITAIRCGGIQLRRALAPILVLGLLIGAALGVFQDRVLVPARLALAGAEEPERDERPVQLGDQWWYVSDTWLFTAAAFDSRQQTLRDVTVFRFGTDQSVSRRLDAEQARYLGEGRWRFTDVVDRNFEDDEALDIRRFETLSLNLGVNLRSAVLRDEAGRPVPERMTLHGLSDAADEASSASEIQLLVSAYHARLALPVSVLVLVLLVIPPALGGSDRDDTSLPIALLKALGLMTLFWTAWTLARLGGQGMAGPLGIAVVWGVMGGALLLGLWRFRGLNE